jgi:hypothetical protein
MGSLLWSLPTIKQLAQSQFVNSLASCYDTRFPVRLFCFNIHDCKFPSECDDSFFVILITSFVEHYIKRKEALHLSSFHPVPGILHCLSCPLHCTALHCIVLYIRLLYKPFFQRDDTQDSTMDRAACNDTNSGGDEENRREALSLSFTDTPTITKGRAPFSKHLNGSYAQPRKRGAFGRDDAVISSFEKQAALEPYPATPIRSSAKEHLISGIGMDTPYTPLQLGTISSLGDTSPGGLGVNTPSPLAEDIQTTPIPFSGQTIMSTGSILDGISPGTIHVFLNLSIDEQEESRIALFPHVHPNVSSFELDVAVETDDTTPGPSANDAESRDLDEETEDTAAAIETTQVNPPTRFSSDNMSLALAASPTGSSIQATPLTTTSTSTRTSPQDDC